MRLRWVLVAVLAALFVRVPAVTTLPMDSDEPIYLEASAEMAQSLREGDWTGLGTTSLNPEHPGLVKLLFGIGQVLQGSDPDLVERLAVARSMSMAASLATVALVAWFHPVAGLALATHTLHSKYGVQAYLDGLPLLWMSLAMLLGWRHRGNPSGRIILLAGACWGAALAGKWLHGLPGLALLWVLPTWRARCRMMVVVLTSMWILDPTMGASPISRVVAMIGAHQDYAIGLSTTTSGLDPLIFLASGLPSQWHPEIFPVSVDWVWFGLGLMGVVARVGDAYGRFL